MMEAQEWEVDTRDGFAEMKALSTAKNLLSKKFGALVQTQMSHKMQLTAAFRSKNEGNKARALRLIQDLGRSLHSTALVSLAYRASADPFGKIRGMIEDMIAKLMQEAAEEADKKAFCDKEMGESTKSKADKDRKLAKISARIEKGDAAVAELTEQVVVLSRELAETSAAVKEATEIRSSEKSEFMKAEKDFSESEDACAAALDVLREYYEGGSFVQVGATSKTKAKTEGDGSGIIGILELAESDFAKLLADVRSKESVAADEYAKMMQDSKLETATKEMEVKGKESELKSLRTSLSNYAGDKEGLDSELQAVLEYLDELKPKCETKVPSYAEIKAKREKEIDGLKEGLNILSQ